MRNQPVFLLGIAIGMLLATEQAAAQKKNSEGYASYAYEDFKNQTRLSDLSQETTGNITSYTCTVACAGKDLQEFTCTGDSLTAQFFALTAQCAPARCLCYFDKIISDGKPLKGFVIEVKE